MAETKALKSEPLPLAGNEAAAYAMMQIDPDVCAAYPITPSTELMQTFAKYVADGKVGTELITVESEHSAMSACIGAAAAGARTMTATSANGLALMWETLYIAASLRLPIIMSIINRALSGNINIHCDHSDAMGCRDTGWMMFFAENAQEAYDLLITTLRTAESDSVRLPGMVCQDGFIISHTMEIVETIPAGAVKDFVGEYEPAYTLLGDDPITVGPLDFHDYYFEHKRAELDAMERAPEVIPEVWAEFADLTGRAYDWLTEYNTDDAEVVLIAMGSTAGTAKYAADVLREQGKKVGVVKLTAFRPFPHETVASALGSAGCVVVLDRAASVGAFGGPLFMEVRNALYRRPDAPEVIGFIYGLGGRDTGPDQIEAAFDAGLKVVETGKVEKYVEYLGVRE
ncbi:MAG: pyruvate ferredoxin oxidoreductase [Candidatus Coatesbacteria bacterium]|nr:MAG: pyruvate ferredoxin oxidoreductase [Candidatus Coatesbacteria bacterium]